MGEGYGVAFGGGWEVRLFVFVDGARRVWGWELYLGNEGGMEELGGNLGVVVLWQGRVMVV